MNENENEYVSLVRIPRKWFYVFVWAFSTLVIANTLVDIFTDWTWKNALGETLFTRMAVLMTLIVGWFFILSHIWEGIMLGAAKLFKDQIRAKVIEEIYRLLEQARKDGKTLDDVLKEHNLEKNGKTDHSSTSKTA